MVDQSLAFVGLRARMMAATCGSVVLIVLATPTPAAAQGFFEAVFGIGRRATYPDRVLSYAPDAGFGPRSDFFPSGRPRLAARHRRNRTHIASPATERLIESAARPLGQAPVPDGQVTPLDPFLNDATLRWGDVVVTSRGLMVYQGGSSEHHAPRDFVSLERAGSQLAAHRHEFASIERVNRYRTPETAAARTASAEPLRIHKISLRETQPVLPR